MRTWEMWTKLFKEQNRETNQMPPSFYDASSLSLSTCIDRSLETVSCYTRLSLSVCLLQIKFIIFFQFTCTPRCVCASAKVASRPAQHTYNIIHNNYSSALSVCVSIVIFREHHLSLSLVHFYNSLPMLNARSWEKILKTVHSRGVYVSRALFFFAWVFIIDLNKNAHLLACLLKVAL